MKSKTSISTQIIAAILLVVATIDLPYGYYNFLRIAITIVGAYQAYLHFEEASILWAILFATTAVLFNPIFPIYFDKSTWVKIDIVGALVFSISAIRLIRQR